MDFFEAQDSARARSRTLVVLFVLAVLAIIATVYLVVHFVLGPGPQATIDPLMLLAVAVGVTLLVGTGSTVRTLQMRQGGAKVAEMLGGRRVRPNTSDPAERRLVNVVEEMAIASGTPVPAIYVLDHEAGINAFAAGYTLDDAAVAVTRGTLERLDRDELQGVIAHEFSHILNGDMRLNIRLIGLLFGILLLAIVGRGLLYGGGRGRGRRDGGNQIAILGLALVAVGYIGVFFGKLIQAAVSRQREYLADAAAVQFTRNPAGIAGALRKIGGAGSRIENHHAQEASHLFFASGLRGGSFSPLATHPPLEERIRRLDPALHGARPGAPQVAATDASARSATARDAGGGDARGAGRSSSADSAATGARPQHAGTAARQATGAQGMAQLMMGAALMERVGAPRGEHVAYAGRLMVLLPEPVTTAAHDRDGAVALLLALLLHGDDVEGAARQHAIIAGHGGEALQAHVASLAAELAPLGAAVRLPLLDLLLPALRELTPEQAARVKGAAEAMVEADDRVEMFELALLHVLNRQLDAGAGERNAARAGAPSVYNFGDVRDAAALVLSAVAWSGAGGTAGATGATGATDAAGATGATDTDPAKAAAAAFGAGAKTLPQSAAGTTLAPRTASSPAAIGDALERLRSATPPIRRRFLEACTHTVAHDGRVQVEEAETLRAVAEAIDCPLPPMV